MMDQRDHDVAVMTSERCALAAEEALDYAQTAPERADAAMIGVGWAVLALRAEQVAARARADSS
jgi:hypothetical protein